LYRLDSASFDSLFFLLSRFGGFGGMGLVGGRRHFGCVALRCSCIWLTVSFMMMGYE
jgi:hypothetical protein